MVSEIGLKGLNDKHAFELGKIIATDDALDYKNIEG